jgi:hypothetical protein
MVQELQRDPEVYGRDVIDVISCNLFVETAENYRILMQWCGPRFEPNTDYCCYLGGDDLIFGRRLQAFPCKKRGSISSTCLPNYTALHPRRQ